MLAGDAFVPETSPFFPMFIGLSGKSVLIAGGGIVACRKAKQVLDFGAAVKIVSPRFVPELEQAGADGRVALYRRPYSSDDMNDVVIAVAATGDRNVNRQIRDDAVLFRIPINVVDDPELCTFYFPSIVRRGPLVAAVSTSGRYPLMAKACRMRMETVLSSGYGTLTEVLGVLRDRLVAMEIDRAQLHTVLGKLLDYGLSLVDMKSPKYTDDEIREKLFFFVSEIVGGFDPERKK